MYMFLSSEWSGRRMGSQTTQPKGIEAYVYNDSKSVFLDKFPFFA